MKGIMKYFAWMLLISGCAAAYRQAPGVRVYQDAKPHVYKVTVPGTVKSGGTGFSISNNGIEYILTNRHVCDVQRDGYVQVNQGHYHELHQVLAVDKNYDLCLVEGRVGDFGLNIARKITFDEPVYLVGHPRLNPLTLRDGFIAEFGPQTVSYCRNANIKVMPTMDLDEILDLFKDCVITAPSYMATLESQPGNSGSPVLNAEHEVVGVLYAGDGNGISILVPLPAIQSFLRSL